VPISCATAPSWSRRVAEAFALVQADPSLLAPRTGGCAPRFSRVGAASSTWQESADARARGELKGQRLVTPKGRTNAAHGGPGAHRLPDTLMPISRQARSSISSRGRAAWA